MLRVGVDTGGTFTDVVLMDEGDGSVLVAKVPSTPDDPSRAFLSGVRKALALAGREAGEVTFVAHGTTVATNALLERRGARTALVTTAGFRDVLEIRRMNRPPELLYDLRAALPPPLVPRRLRFEVPERMSYRGEVLVPLDEAAVEALAPSLAGVESIAVSLLFSYANAAHERRVGEILEQRLPGVPVSLSSDVLPEFREYERTATTTISAYVRPLVAEYFVRSAERLRSLGVASRFYVMQSNGGMAAPEVLAATPVHTLLSGPSAGVIASSGMPVPEETRGVITLDVGGTSSDVALLPDGQPQRTDQRTLMGMPVKVPMLDIETIGAGGGSIAWTDAAGAFRVGPRSAGAVPGPAAYGTGGREPTLTDAALVLGYLSASRALGGEVRLRPDLAHHACEELGRRLGLGVEAVAEGIFTIASSAMVGAIRAVSVRRGYDPRDFALVAFGGAGPVHGAAVASELEMRRVIVPPFPGCHSAMGLVVADIAHDYVHSMIAPLDELAPEVIETLYARLAARAGADLDRDGVPADRWLLTRTADVRYLGQSYAITVPAPPALRGAADASELRTTFDREHARRFGYDVPGEPVELVNVRLTAVGLVDAPRKPVGGRARRGAAAAPERRAMRFAGAGPVEGAVYWREDLAPGDRLTGPAVIEQVDATTLVPPGWGAAVDEASNLILEDRARARA